MQRVLVTGASGFVGRQLCAALVREGWAVRAALRPQADRRRLPPGVECRVVGDIGPETRWDAALLAGVDTVVHLAARVHVLRERAEDPDAAFRQTNVLGTERLAAAAAGRVRRFVYVSSLHAVRTLSDEVLDETSPCRPDTPYGRSKLEAEQVLSATRDRTGLDVVVVRPAPVYGPDGTGNLAALLRWVRRGWLLPLAGIDNRRSLLYVGNLVSALRACIETPAAAGQTFLVSDGETVSTSELICRAAAAAGRSARLWPAPLTLLRSAARLCGRSASLDRLIGSLAVDITRLRQALSWQPAFTLDEGLRATVRGLETEL